MFYFLLAWMTNAGRSERHEICRLTLSHHPEKLALARRRLWANVNTNSSDGVKNREVVKFITIQDFWERDWEAATQPRGATRSFYVEQSSTESNFVSDREPVEQWTHSFVLDYLVVAIARLINNYLPSSALRTSLRLPLTRRKLHFSFVAFWLPKHSTWKEAHALD